MYPAAAQDFPWLRAEVRAWLGEDLTPNRVKSCFGYVGSDSRISRLRALGAGIEPACKF